MPEKMTMSYESEIRDTLDRIGRENGHIRSFPYFTACAWQWFDPEQRKTVKPAVAVLGPGVPGELILAAGAAPYYILGGSLKSGAWSEDLVPRDTDPVSRSVLGFLQDPEGPDYSGTLFIVPVTSDSMRKTAYLLREQGRNVHIVDVPPQRSDFFAREKWQAQMIAMTEAVSRHTRTRVTAARVRSAIETADCAAKALREFLSASCGREDLITGGARLLVQNSYYYTGDLSRWTAELRRLNEELRSRRKRFVPGGGSRPGILLMGSPVYFPNYKIPFLIQDIGLNVLRNIDVTTLKDQIRPVLPGKRRSRDTLIRMAADRWYDQDGSPAYAANDALYRSVVRCLKQDRIEGVVYHVLKGQIEYDFELERLEALFDRYGIPVFRLATDYQYQDVEQLRIRMEAFSEMLHQNRYREERMAQ